MVGTIEKKMDIMVSQESKAELEEVMNFIETMDDIEKREFLAFIRGANFTKILGRTIA